MSHSKSCFFFKFEKIRQNCFRKFARIHKICKPKISRFIPMGCLENGQATPIKHFNISFFI